MHASCITPFQLLRRSEKVLSTVTNSYVHKHGCPLDIVFVGQSCHCLKPTIYVKRM
jgi:hypothetical protein